MEYVELRDDEPPVNDGYIRRVGQLKHLLKLENRLAAEQIRQKKLAAIGYTGRRMEENAEYPEVRASDFSG